MQTSLKSAGLGSESSFPSYCRIESLSQNLRKALSAGVHDRAKEHRGQHIRSISITLGLKSGIKTICCLRPKMIEIERPYTLLSKNGGHCRRRVC
jgi:hypothetical protein